MNAGSDAATSEVWDRDAVLEAFGGSESLLRETCEMLPEEALPLLQQMEEAASAGDATALERAAHRLKGAVAMFAAPRAHQALLALEQMGREGRLEGSPSAVATARERVEELLAAVRTPR